MTETIAELVAAHRAGQTRPDDTVARAYQRLRDADDPAIFISLRDEGDAFAEARALAGKDPSALPLFGIPVAVKDNIDVAGLPTTAACPAFSYQPAADAAVVAKLRRAGAIVIGKTNLDQFATGLVGVRSPYGIPRNALNPALIPGGSSAGSAVAVARGIVPLALGTDTAGSGRVPAMLNNIVGLKPSVGLVSNHGMVPACRTLDCVSLFALTTDDAWTALNVVAGHDPHDPYSRRFPPSSVGSLPPNLRIGVPVPEQRLFAGDDRAAQAYEAALARVADMGAQLVALDIAPLLETARLLYEGPWIAERYLAVETLISAQPDALHPVTREIISGGRAASALQAFAAFYRLEEMRRAAETLFAGIDALMVPTAPRTYTTDEVLADPIQLNSRLGTYTNFVNLLNLCGLAVPSSLDGDRPFGITLLAPAGADARLASIGRALHAKSRLPLGALGKAQPALPPLPAAPAPGEVAVAVVGAHLSGMPLNRELQALGGRFIQATTTAPVYRLYELPGGAPAKPGLLRAGGGGVAIEVEVWALSAEAFGTFVAAVPPPLSIGTITLSHGGAVKGFLVEASAVAGARDISSFGGWRAFTGRTAAEA